MIVCTKNYLFSLKFPTPYCKSHCYWYKLQKVRSEKMLKCFRFLSHKKYAKWDPYTAPHPNSGLPALSVNNSKSESLAQSTSLNEGIPLNRLRKNNLRLVYISFLHFNIYTPSMVWLFKPHDTSYKRLINVRPAGIALTQKLSRPLNSCNCFKVTFVWIAMLCTWDLKEISFFLGYLDSHILCINLQVSVCLNWYTDHWQFVL